ncbi:MAG: Tryptophan--tRNA ligase 2 [Chlamydiae bacterium]|nr:Tryptophan--tRNA ligase 2 [Chlamydiota bacterium]
MDKKIILTGDRPTGPLHLGHYVGSLKNRVELQDTCTQFIIIADAQALTDHAKEPEKVRESVLQVALDYLAVGIDPAKSTIFIQTLIPELFELTSYYLNLITWNRLKHNPTVKAEIVQKGFGEAVPAGFMVYPVSQAADITAFKADLVPVGEDQRPMLEQTNEIVRHFNQTYGQEVLVRAEALIPKMARLPGTDGNEKMSKSIGNCIFLSDPPEVIKKKIMRMISDPSHTDIEAPGKVEGNPVFTYLDTFDPDTAKVQELKDHYQKGGLGDGTLKKYLNEVLQTFLEPIRKKREEFAKDPAHVMEILKKGTEKARQTASATLSEVRDAMGINYF